MLRSQENFTTPLGLISTFSASKRISLVLKGCNESVWPGADSPKGLLRPCRPAQQHQCSQGCPQSPWGVILVQREIAALSYCSQLGWDIPPSCSSRAGCAMAERFAVLTSSVGLDVVTCPSRSILQLCPGHCLSTSCNPSLCPVGCLCPAGTIPEVPWDGVSRTDFL